MSQSPLHSAFRRIVQDLSESGRPCALVGGLAVTARTEPRFTKDVDIAVAATSDTDAEALVQFLLTR
jgi:hypothetical protein